MKHFLLLAATVFSAFACSTPNTYTVKGTVADSLFNGKYVFLVNSATGKPIDSSLVTDGQFTFTGPTDSLDIMRIALSRAYSADIIAQAGTILVELKDGSTVSGTPLNEELQKYKAEKDSLGRMVSGQMADLKTRQGDKIDEAQYDSILNKVYYPMEQAITDKYLQGHTGDALGLFVIWRSDKLYDMSLSQMDSVLNILGGKAQNFGPLVKIHTAKMNLENTQVGKMFSDFDALNPDGSAAKLSDYVGKGNYVLADFWASWCGPCRAEVPNLKEIYEQYKDKGLVVLGVNVWDKKASFEEAVQKLEMPWAQICNFDTATATDIYGISGIPHIILFAPDGTIQARGLRGQEMKSTVGELFNK